MDENHESTPTGQQHGQVSGPDLTILVQIMHDERATYDLGFGVIERPNNTENKYEVPAQ